MNGDLYTSAMQTDSTAYPASLATGVRDVIKISLATLTLGILWGCFNTLPVETHSLTPKDVNYSVKKEQSCFSTEMFKVNYPAHTKFDSVRACISSDSIENCETGTHWSFKNGDGYFYLHSDRFSEKYVFSFKTFYNDNVLDSGSFDVSGVSRESVNKIPQRVVFYFKYDSLEYNYNFSDSTYWSGLLYQTQMVKHSHSFHILESAPVLDSIGVYKFPINTTSYIIDYNVLQDTGIDSGVSFRKYYPKGDGLVFPIGNRHLDLQYRIDPDGESDSYHFANCLEINYQTTSNLLGFITGDVDFNPEFMLVWAYNTAGLFIDSKLPGQRFLCGYGPCTKVGGK